MSNQNNDFATTDTQRNTTTDDNNNDDDCTFSPALVFGASGEQGRAVVEGLVEHGYAPVYAFTSALPDSYLTDALNAVVFAGDVSCGDHVRSALTLTRAQVIFFVTTCPTSETSHCADAAEREYQVIANFFDTLKQVYQNDHLSRHVVFSTRENVQRLNQELFEQTGDVWIDNVLNDGSVVPHYSAKGRGAEYATALLQDTPGLKLTLLTMPFLFSNFLAFFAPLPNEGHTQWTLSACLGDGANKIDMMGAADLAAIVPNVFAYPDKYNGVNLRLVGQHVSMDDVAKAFSDLFGKDVIYNPLTVAELAALPFATAGAMAQMCQFLGDPRTLRHDLAATYAAAFPKRPQTFADWLLTHSDSTAFRRVGLDRDAPEITRVTVFDATSPEGTSVVKGLLADSRKSYRIRAATRHVEAAAARTLQQLDPSRIELVAADWDDLSSCRRAVQGVGGAFAVTEFLAHDRAGEERHARNVIDACADCSMVQHLVFSTMESAEEMNRLLNLSTTLPNGQENQQQQQHEDTVWPLDAKARTAAYARTKQLSVTYVVLPCYSELVLEQIGTDYKHVLSLSLRNNAKVTCLSMDDLGPAVANIFDSYQVYAGHEIGLVTDFVTMDHVKSKNNNTTNPDRLEEEKTLESISSRLEPSDTYMKDLGQMFAYMAHTDAVKMRQSIAQTMKLIPSTRPLRKWVEQNADNVEFREKLGLQ